MVHKHAHIFMVDNEHGNEGLQCSSVPMYTLVVHKVALYRLGGAQTILHVCYQFFLVVHNAVLSV